jgi:hypothetical protein
MRTIGSSARKRLQHNLGLPSSKRPRVAEGFADNDDFIPIEFFDAPAGATKVPAKTPRRRKSTHVTDSGSPQKLTKGKKDKGQWSNLLDPLDDAPATRDVQSKAPPSTPVAANRESRDLRSIYPQSDVSSPPKEAEASAPVAKMLPSRPKVAEVEDEDLTDELSSPDPAALGIKQNAAMPSMLPSGSEATEAPMAARRLDEDHTDVIRDTQSNEPQSRNHDDPFASSKSRDDAVEPDFVQKLRSVSAKSVAPPTVNAADVTDLTHADEMEIDSDSSSDVDMDEAEAQDKAAEAEWEAALRPRHRTLLASLNRITRQFLSHVMDCESVLAAEVNEYLQKGGEILKDMDEKHVEQIRKLKAKIQHGGRMGVDPIMVSKMRVEHKKTKDSAHKSLFDWQKMHDGRVKQVKDFRARVEG